MTKENEKRPKVLLIKYDKCSFDIFQIHSNIRDFELSVLRIFLVQHVYFYVFVFRHRFFVVAVFAIGINFSSLFILYFLRMLTPRVAPQDVTYNLTQKRSFRVRFSKHYLQRFPRQSKYSSHNQHKRWMFFFPFIEISR